MAEEKILDEQQRRQSSSMGSLPVSRSSDSGRRQHTEEARSKAASSYALPCPPDSRRRASRDTLSKSLGANEFRFAQPVAVPSGRNYHQAQRDYQQASSHGAQSYSYYYVPEHPYAQGCYASYTPVGSYEWKEPTLGPPPKMRQPMATHVNVMHQAGDVASGSAATLAAKQQASTGQDASPGETDSEWSPTKELMEEDARSAVYYAGTAWEDSSVDHDKNDAANESSISNASSSDELNDNSIESEVQKQEQQAQMDPPPPQRQQSAIELQEQHMQKIQQMRHHHYQLRQQKIQQMQQQLQQHLNMQLQHQEMDDPQAAIRKEIRAEPMGRPALSPPPVLPAPPMGPPPGYFPGQPSRETGSKETEARSQFSVVSLAAPLLPASAASLANRSAMEQACILVNVVLLSVLTGIVAAFLVRQLT